MRKLHLRTLCSIWKLTLHVSLQSGQLLGALADLLLWEHRRNAALQAFGKKGRH